MAFYDFLADGKTDAGSGILCFTVEPLKNDKNPFGILRVYPDPVVAYREQSLAVFSFGSDADFRRFAIAELDSVADKVLK